MGQVSVALKTMDLWFAGILQHSVLVLVIFHLSHSQMAEGVITCFVRTR